MVDLWSLDGCMPSIAHMTWLDYWYWLCFICDTFIKRRINLKSKLALSLSWYFDQREANIYDIATDCFLSSLQFNPSAELKYQAFVIPLVPNGVKVLLSLYTIDQKSQGVCSYPSSQSCTCFKLDSSNNKIMLYQILSFLSQTFCCKKVFQLEY